MAVLVSILKRRLDCKYSKGQGASAKLLGFTRFLNYFQTRKAVHQVYMTHRPCDSGDAPVHHGPATMGRSGLAGISTRDRCEARGLIAGEEKEQVERRDSHHVPQLMMQWRRWPDDEEEQRATTELDGMTTRLSRGETRVGNERDEV
jgi:hypothetical protein